jgi:hypothetical protein
VPGPEQSRDQLIDQLRAENAGLRADNQRLRAENEDLTGRLARLERLISRNSGFSELRVRGRLDELAASSVRRRA